MDSMQNLFVFLRKFDRFCVVTVVSFRDGLRWSTGCASSPVYKEIGNPTS